MRVSLAVTAYEETTRGGPPITECIRAAVDHPAIDEIVVVDDYSSDYDDLVDLLAGTPKVNLTRNSKNLGVFGNKLAAVANSTGDWVINSDSDNIFDDVAIDRVLATELNPWTWYCPSFARPVFDYRDIVGVYDESSIQNIKSGKLWGCFVNTGNQTVNREEYLNVFGQYLNQRADVMMPNFLDLKDHEREGEHWRLVFDACDSFMFNLAWLRNCGRLAIVEGFEYEHFHTVDEDSNFIRAPQAKYKLNDILMRELDSLGKEN